MNYKELSKQEERFIGGHTLCPGCAEGIIIRAVLHATKHPVVVAGTTGCSEVSTTKYPITSWRTPYIHNAFANVSSTLSGIETAYQVLKNKGKLKKEIKLVAFSGDGGLYDIGLQALSGTLERGHDVLIVCLDNETYANTGFQRSSATPYGTRTKTSELGKIHKGKQEFRKDIVKIVEAHDIPYVAQASTSNYLDLVRKAHQGFKVKGPAFLNVLSPCIPGWKIPSNITISISKLAVETNFWPLVEVKNGKWILNYKPEKRKPIQEFLKPQGRFKHLLKPENKHILEKLQKHVDKKFEELVKKC